MVSVLMTKILKTHFNFQIFFLFILSYILWDLPLYIIFSISWLNDLLNFLFYLQKLVKMKRYKPAAGNRHLKSQQEKIHDAAGVERAGSCRPGALQGTTRVFTKAVARQLFCC